VFHNQLSIPFPIYRVPIILASKSLRRIDLMRQAGLQFTVQLAGETDEVYPLELQREEIPLYLARLKADAFLQAVSIPDDTIVVTADTIVWIDNRVLGKPSGREDAIHMLETLSGNMHRVYTGVCLTTTRKQHAFSAESRVFFRKLTGEEITFYVDRCQPYDKAGAYGIQEWIGYVGIEKIEGSYYNVMGLPIQKLYHELCDFISK
jgi:septum formation protein